MQLTPTYRTRPTTRHFAQMAARLAPALLSVALLAGGAAQPATAQNLFAPAISVNDDVVTHFELEQRTRFLQLLNAPGDPAKLAREALIDDRLRQQAVTAAGITVADEDVTAGIEEFAGRTNLSADQLVAALAEGGVAEQTLRDFTKVSLAWRDLIQARYLARARPTDTEIDRALGQSTSGGGVRVLLSEIIIPVTQQTAEQVSALAEELSQLTSTAAFSEAASRYSATETRNRGGRMDWIAVSNLPPQLRPLVLALSQGEVTAPIPLPDAVALFQLRGIQEIPGGAPSYSAIDYATYYIAGGRSAEALAVAAGVKARVDTCDDLYGIAKGQPAEVLERKSSAPGEIPRDIALELAKLDDGEISTALTRSNGQTLVLLMLCGRTAELNQDASREDVARALTQQRLASFAESLLEQLRADALIIEQ